VLPATNVKLFQLR